MDPGAVCCMAGSIAGRFFPCLGRVGCLVCLHSGEKGRRIGRSGNAAGVVLDKVRAGEHITNKDIGKLNLFTDAGVAAVNEALGTNMRRQNTASNMRKAFREAVAQYQKMHNRILTMP